MGYKISWMAFTGLDHGDVLERVALTETDQTDEANEAPFSVARLPTGWTIIWSNDFDWASPERARRASPGAKVIAVQCHEGVMWSDAYLAEDGQTIWRVFHDGQQPGFRHGQEGSPTAELWPIVDRLRTEQEADTSGQVDYAFDIPIELAFTMTGFRHDRCEFEWGEPVFRVGLPETRVPRRKVFGLF